MKKLVVAGSVAVGLIIGSAGAVSAADRGNHGAIWSASQHGVDSGQEWGELIGEMASHGDLKPFGVSEGVHLAKDQPVPGQNK